MTDSAQLPERVRLRVVSLVSAVLPSVLPVPAPLRKVAGFAPARRARLGGTAIWAALQDEDFRAHAAVQVAPVAPVENDPVDAAARAWLTRQDGWEAVVEDIRQRFADTGADDIDRAQLEIERLNASVASLQSDLATARAEHEERLARAKADHTVLRRRLGEARAAARAFEADRDEARADRAAAIIAADAATSAAQAEVRRARSQLEEASSALASTRRDTRTARDAATIRARYLLETVVEAATGLRRELGLPAVDGTPGGEVEDALVSHDAARTSSAPPTPAVLEQLLSMPRSRLLIDGYNVTKGAWPSASLEAQRSRLVTALAPLVARTGAETTVVFDAGSAGVRTAMPSPRGVRVVFSPEGVIADDVIQQLVDAEPRGRVVVVVTGDQELGRNATRAGARVVPTTSLLSLVES